MPVRTRLSPNWRGLAATRDTGRPAPTRRTTLFAEDASLHRPPPRRMRRRRAPPAKSPHIRAAHARGRRAPRRPRAATLRFALPRVDARGDALAPRSRRLSHAVSPLALRSPTARSPTARSHLPAPPALRLPHARRLLRHALHSSPPVSIRDGGRRARPPQRVRVDRSRGVGSVGDHTDRGRPRRRRRDAEPRPRHRLPRPAGHGPAHPARWPGDRLAP